jgi:hypothetical protein
LAELFNTKYEKFWGRPVKRPANVILLFYRRYMVDSGLLEEIVEDVIPNAAREANLQETL